eukprot:15695937-Heterocapsa_arctica.AAC.1
MLRDDRGCWGVAVCVAVRWIVWEIVWGRCARRAAVCRRIVSGVRLSGDVCAVPGSRVRRPR